MAEVVHLQPKALSAPRAPLSEAAPGRSQGSHPREALGRHVRVGWHAHEPDRRDSQRHRRRGAAFQVHPDRPAPRLRILRRRPGGTGEGRSAGRPEDDVLALREADRRYGLVLGESIIGRDPGAAVFLDDRSVSRRHARIVVSKAGPPSKTSAARTARRWEAGRSAAPLADESQIRIGSVALTFRIFPLAESTQTNVES